MEKCDCDMEWPWINRIERKSSDLETFFKLHDSYMSIWMHKKIAIQLIQERDWTFWNFGHWPCQHNFCIEGYSDHCFVTAFQHFLIVRCHTYAVPSLSETDSLWDCTNLLEPVNSCIMQGIYMYVWDNHPHIFKSEAQVPLLHCKYLSPSIVVPRKLSDLESEKTFTMQWTTSPTIMVRQTKIPSLFNFWIYGNQANHTSCNQWMKALISRIIQVGT